MKPVFQTIPAPDGKGNCLQACIASILELSLEQVPHFALWYDSSDWHEKMNDWLMETAGIYEITVAANSMYLEQTYGFAILNGMSERGVMHSVVIHNGLMVHDPYPGGTGIATPESYGLFICTQPARLVPNELKPSWRSQMNLADPDWDNPHRYD
jgi:hypothetical protein